MRKRVLTSGMFALTVALTCAAPNLNAGETLSFSRDIPVMPGVDVVVCGGGPAGCAAAIAAKRSGLKVLLVEGTSKFGGMATSGMVTHWLGGRNDEGEFVVGGLFKEFSEGAAAAGAAKLPKMPKDTVYQPHAWLPWFIHGVVLDPDRTAWWLERKLRGEGVDFLFETRAVDVVKAGSRITHVVIHNKSGLSAVPTKAVIDATGDADMAAKAGCPFELGRKEDGLATASSLIFHVTGIDAAKLQRTIEATRSPKFRELIEQLRAKGEWPFPTEIFISVQTLDEDAAMINMTRLMKVDGTNARSRTEAYVKGRDEALAMLKVLKKHFAGFERAELKGIAPLLGVRESRRITGKFQMTVRDLMEDRPFPDTIGFSMYGWDLPDPLKVSVQPFVNEEGGGFVNKTKKPLATPIPFRVMVPQGADNLLCAGRSISVERDVLGPLREMAPCMAMGEAAGVAAAQLVKGVAGEAVDTEAVRAELRRRGAIVDRAKLPVIRPRVDPPKRPPAPAAAAPTPGLPTAPTGETLFVPTGAMAEDAWRDLVRMPDGEIRHYGWDTSKTPVARIYESSADGGRTWTRKRALNRREGAMVKCPWADYWLTLDCVNWRSPQGEAFTPFSAKAARGPGDPATVFHDVALPGFSWNRQPVPLASRKRWICSGNAKCGGGDCPGFAISDDDGATWRLVLAKNVVRRPGVVAPDKMPRWENYCCEPALLERRDGSLLAVVRTTMGRHYRIESRDGGETWSAPQPMPGIYASNTSPYLHRLRDGRILLLWNNTEPLPTPDPKAFPEIAASPWMKSGHGETAFTNRDVLHAAVSSDEGETWSGFREIRLNDISARADFRLYGNDTRDSLDKSIHQTQAVELDDGTLVVADGQSPLVRRLGRFDPACLAARNRYEDFRQGLVNVATHLFVNSYYGDTTHHGHCAYNRTDGALLVPDPVDRMSKREVLQLCRIDDPRLLSPRQGVVWNFPAARKGRVEVDGCVIGAGYRLTLADRWFNPSDESVAARSPFSLAVDAATLGGARRWARLLVAWDADAGRVTASVGGRVVAEKPFSLSDFSPYGVSYLHLQTLAETPDAEGSYVRSFAMAADGAAPSASAPKVAAADRVLKVDFTRAAGPVKPLHGVNNGPMRPLKEAKDKWHQNEFKAAGIPFMRTHDTVGMWGGTHYVDIPNVFPNFDADENDPKSYDFKLTDGYLEPFVNAGVKIFYRLGVTIENYHWLVRYTTNPPKDFAKWARICEHVVRHYNDGWADGFKWNIEHWEIWNEPEELDPKGSAMWSGTKEQFFELYRLAANEIKAKHPNVKVGGYGGLGFYAVDSKPRWPSFKAAAEWFDDFCAYVTDPKTKAPLDFFSWHLYVDQGFGMERIATHAKHVRETLDRHGLTAAASYLDEWNDMNGIWDQVCGEKRRYSDLKGVFGATSAAAGFAVMQSVSVDGAMYYDACPRRSYCGLFTYPDMETTACYSVFKAFNDLYRLGTSVSVEPAFGRGVYALAAKDAAGRQAVWLVNKNKASVDITPSFKGGAAVYAVSVLEGGQRDFVPRGTVKAGASLTLPATSVTVLSSGAPATLRK